MVAKQQATEKPSVDWEAMKPEWIEGKVSISELERRYKVTRKSIREYWARKGITRNKAAEIQHAAATIVQRAEAVGADSLPPAADPARAGAPTEDETVALNARVQAAAILKHRRILTRAQGVTDRLLRELEAQAHQPALFERMEQLLRAAAKDGKAGANLQALKELQGLFERTTSFPGRVDSLRRLSEAIKVLTELERRVLGIADDTPVDPGERVKEAVDQGMAKLRERFAQRGVKVPAP